jgi:hypothetical protein
MLVERGPLLFDKTKFLSIAKFGGYMLYTYLCEIRFFCEIPLRLGKRFIHSPMLCK